MTRVYVSDDRTVVVRVWNTQEIEVSTRDHAGDVWGPPVRVTEEKLWSAIYGGQR